MTTTRLASWTCAIRSSSRQTPAAIDTVAWAAQYQLPANVQNLILQSASGGTGVGNNLNNLLVAQGASTYTLIAGTGNDVFIGNGSGDPTDTGGTTTFVIQQGDGDDVISNFVNGVDQVRLLDYSSLTSLSAVQAAMTQDGSDVALNWARRVITTFSITKPLALAHRQRF